MAWVAYLFEIRQIQAYVFATGKLRDASGASELLDSLCGLDDQGHAAGLAAELASNLGLAATFYRSTGGVLDMAGEDADGLTRFRALFRLAVARRAPGLVYADSLGRGQTAEEAREDARRRASDGGPVRGANLPLGSPMVRPAPRSGGSPAVVTGWTKGGRCAITGEFADLPTLAKRQFLKAGHRRLADRFLPGAIAEAERPRWPDVFALREDETDAGRTVFPFDGQEIPRIALVHADGNGMGKLFAEAARALKPVEMPKLSLALSMATRAAVQVGMQGIAEAGTDKVVPARPVLLGGDDVTLILRADLAFGFARRFVTAFEDKATAAVRRFKDLRNWPKLTVKVGIVTFGPNQPFARVYDLCEDLARVAGDPQHSRVAFWRIAGAEIPDAVDELVEQGAAADGVTLWRAAHRLDELQRLEQLAVLLGDDDVGRGGLRRVAELAKTSRTEANRVFLRALQNVQRRDRDVEKRLKTSLESCGMGDKGIEAGGYCPLLQAHDLSHILVSRKREEAVA